MKKKILFVDDDRLILSSMGKGLEMLGYQVCLVAESEKALAIAQEENFDIALLDIRMPTIDGIELAKKLIKHQQLPVIFLSAYSDENIVEAALKCGYVSYLLKPCSLHQLKLSIETALNKFHQLKEVETECGHLEKALTQSRMVSMAIGFLMSECRLNEKAAFEKLRQQARDQRRKIHDVACELLLRFEREL
ncbi:ANTAR domain-containing response regulator [methane-oxidizing endosymbiont of Gigantopelta aegis]|uniref:ANTAR domain-containing response regulator n=1 Tax=methane-oxidizing endosymbiont of Gigantopelta aegis TaxID=2794938 RepID=UPI0018DE9649|nr:response regulator [methane-oxidizing endosymbiont of Gigantopelta aegis]